MITFGEKTPPGQITAWLHDQIAAKSPLHAEMVAAYREGRRLPDDQLPEPAALPGPSRGSRYKQEGGTA